MATIEELIEELADGREECRLSDEVEALKCAVSYPLTDWGQGCAEERAGDTAYAERRQLWQQLAAKRKELRQAKPPAQRGFVTRLTDSANWAIELRHHGQESITLYARWETRALRLKAQAEAAGATVTITGLKATY